MPDGARRRGRAAGAAPGAAGPAGQESGRATTARSSSPLSRCATENLEGSLSPSSQSQGKAGSASPRRRERHAEEAERKAIWYLGMPLRWRSISYPTMFALGSLCSLSVGWFRPERMAEPVRKQAVRASAAMSKALDEMLSSDTVEGLLNTTLKMREVLDMQAATISAQYFNISGRLRAPRRLKEMFSGSPLSIKELLGSFQIPSIQQVLGRSERVGVRAARQGLTVHSPVVMIPGIITTGLEVWEGEACMNTFFRQRIWGTVSMFQSLMANPECWARHLGLNATTGLDPLQRPGLNRSIRVRPAQGFESSDFFIGGYWLWGLMIEALADIGYDVNSMYMASYDWRLSFADLEKRDRYFTRLRQQIETLVALNGRKAVVIAHSMGGNVWHYFMQWVTHRVHRTWVNDHIVTEVLVSVPLLGLPKAYFSLLTGDNRDFATLGTFSAIVDYFLSQETRRILWRSCSSLAMLLPMGGDRLWGGEVHGRTMVTMGGKNLSMEEAYDLIASESSVPEDLRRISPWILDGLRQWMVQTSKPSELSAEPPEHHWGNPLAVALPFAPDLQIYSFYGTGVQTEYSGEVERDESSKEEARYNINRDATENGGFYLGDGDYSCPVFTLGMMCYKGWANKQRNPSRAPCTVKEFQDKPTTLLAGRTIRGGAASGDHIDILGNDELLTDVLNIASGRHVEERIISNLRNLAEKWRDV